MKKTFFIFLFIFSCAFAAYAQARVNLRLPAEAKVQNDTFTLGEIAQISGDGEKAKRLQAISLGYAPNIGMTRELAKEKISLAIAAAGFSAGDFALDSPPTVRIQRAGQQVGQRWIRETVEKSILSQFTENKVEARIMRLDLPEKIDVPIGDISVRTNLSGVQNLFAPFALSIEIRVNDTVVRRLAANVEVEAFAEVFVAAKDLPMDTKISEDDVRLEKRRLEKPLTSYLREPENLRGIKLIKTLGNGSVLTSDTYVAGTVVRAGDLVRIVGQSGRMQITVNGEARTSGKIGDRIAVKNSQSNLVIQATVVDEGLVKVYF